MEVNVKEPEVTPIADGKTIAIYPLAGTSSEIIKLKV
jgi:hypothetical protein